MRRQAPNETRSDVWQKLGASVINATAASVAAAPAGVLGGFEAWRVALLVAWFASALIWNRQCLGCRVMGTVPNRPTTVRYAALYTLGLASFVFWIWQPGDLAVANGLIQGAFLVATGNTAHGWLSGIYTSKA